MSKIPTSLRGARSRLRPALADAGLLWPVGPHRGPAGRRRARAGQDEQLRRRHRPWKVHAAARALRVAGRARGQDLRSQRAGRSIAARAARRADHAADLPRRAAALLRARRPGRGPGARHHAGLSVPGAAAGRRPASLREPARQHRRAGRLPVAERRPSLPVRSGAGRPRAGRPASSRPACSSAWPSRCSLSG